MKTSAFKNTSIAVILAVILCCIVFYLSKSDSAKREQVLGKAELKRFYQSLELCSTKKEFREAFQRGNYKTLELRNFSSDFYEVRTPHEFGANNWILYAVFTKGNLHSYYVRYNDNHNHKPQNAPTDKLISQC